MNLTAQQAAEMQARVALTKRGEQPTPLTTPSLAAPKKPRLRPERAEQVALAARLDAALPPFSWFHVPNERSSAKQAGELQEEGVKSGVPDILITLPTPANEPGAAIEMKDPKKKTRTNSFSGTSENQRGWLWVLASRGWRVCVAYSADEAWAFVCEVYLIGGVK